MKLTRRHWFYSLPALAGLGAAGCGQRGDSKIVDVHKDNDPTKRGPGGLDTGSELELAYCIQLDSGDGHFREVTDTHDFHSGDRLRLQVRPGFAAYLYLLDRGTKQGSFTLLFPNSKINIDNPIDAKRTITVPGEDGPAMKLDEKPGNEHFVIVAANLLLPQFNTTEKSIPAEDVEDRIAEVERKYRPGSFRRFQDGNWMKLFAAGTGTSRDVAIVLRLPIQHLA